ncbi:hypothetical protein [Ferirhizobium litorale]|uniref:Uncharacterized protein n=1 Tax=Ferirhizobium litorale TaxID=2927786 RepID=A0AAE3QH47_9HYPH|nr:hypothetical protein [Fererhizobium litorale]MDI7923405.1 hypothetical protein [Fererhizobium litorale]
MAHEVNGARGEVALRAGGEDLVIAATMHGLAAVSTQLECKSLADLFERLSGVEVGATLAAIQCLTVRGDKIKALGKIKLKDFKACAAAFNAALSHHFEGDEGNDQAAEEAI